MYCKIVVLKSNDRHNDNDASLLNIQKKSALERSKLLKCLPVKLRKNAILINKIK